MRSMTREPDRRAWPLAQRMAGATDFSSDGETPFVERPAWQRLVGLGGLFGLQLSLLALLAAVLGVLSIVSMPSVGIVGPVMTLVLSAEVMWRFRSRRKSAQEIS